MLRTIHRLFDRDELFTTCAEWIATIAAESIAQRGRFSLALAGGSTPRGLYQLLAGDFRDQIDWGSVFFFWGDERNVSADHEDSNFRMANEALLKPLGIDHNKDRSNVFPILTDLPSPAAAAQAYEHTLGKFFEAPRGDTPAIDLVLLGMGGDGHTLSLFPNTNALDENERWVVSNEVPQLATSRITLTAPFVNAARHVAFLVAGHDKAARLADVIQGTLQPRQLPSQLIRPTNGKLHWFIDDAAGAKLVAEP